MRWVRVGSVKWYEIQSHYSKIGKIKSLSDLQHVFQKKLVLFIQRRKRKMYVYMQKWQMEASYAYVDEGNE